MAGLVDDLRFAQASGVAVEVQMLSGQVFKLVGVHEVNEEENFASLHTPQHFGDETTTTKVDLGLIGSVTVTEVVWT